MRWVFWFLWATALAVALALLAGHNDGTVTLFWPPHRFDVSFNLVFFGLLGLFVLLHAALRAGSAMRALPQRAQSWRLLQQERAVVGAIVDALSHQLAGRFVRAQTSAQHAIEQLRQAPGGQWPRQGQWTLLAHLLLAESAQALRDPARRDTHLKQALASDLASLAPQAREGALLRAARWAIEDQDPAMARRWLGELPQGAARRIQALRLKLRAARLAGDAADALDTARLLIKHRAFAPATAQVLLRSLWADAVRQAHDLSQLDAVWQRLDKRERETPELMWVLAQRAHVLMQGLNAEGGDVAARQALAQRVQAWTEPLWAVYSAWDASQREAMVQAMESSLEALDHASFSRLEQAQRRLPDDPALQYLVGQACMRAELWGRAALLMGQAVHGLRDVGLRRRAWCALARLAEERGDMEAAQKAWKTAALLSA